MFPKSAVRLAFASKYSFQLNRKYSTLRISNKWIKHALNEKQEIVLLGPDGKPMFQGKLLEVYYVPIRELALTWLAYDIESRCHTLAGALAFLRETYDPFATPDTFASVVWYTVECLV